MVQQVPPTGLSNNRPFRNKIINGDFNIFQRSTSAVTAGNNTYTTADRWKTQISTDGAMTTEKESLSLADQATTGSASAWEIKCTSTDSSIASNQYALFLQSIEAQFVQDLLYGTSSAKTLTCSFWVKSSLTGIYGFFFIKGDTTAYYLPIEFTISSANTWEKKIIEISPTAGSTSLITGSGGVINNDNGIGLDIGICLAMGSNFHGTNNTWTTSGHYTTSNQVNFLSNTSNNFYITSFQLEVGDDATEFEVLPHDIQLERCRRYCQQHTSTGSDYYGYGVGHAVNANLNSSHFYLHPNMNGPASLETSSTASDFAIYSQNSGVDACDALPVINGTGDSASGGIRIMFQSTGSITADNIHENLSNNAVTFIRFVAEL